MSGTVEPDWDAVRAEYEDSDTPLAQIAAVRKPPLSQRRTGKARFKLMSDKARLTQMHNDRAWQLSLSWSTDICLRNARKATHPSSEGDRLAMNV